MQYPSSGAEVTRLESRGVSVRLEEQGLRAVSQSDGENMGTECGPIGSLQEIYSEGGCVWSGRKEKERKVKKEKRKPPFRGSPEGVVSLGAGLCSLRSRMRGVHDPLTEDDFIPCSQHKYRSHPHTIFGQGSL
jgi:hypothetical protein